MRPVPKHVQFGFLSALRLLCFKLQTCFNCLSYSDFLAPLPPLTTHIIHPKPPPRPTPSPPPGYRRHAGFAHQAPHSAPAFLQRGARGAWKGGAHGVPGGERVNDLGNGSPWDEKSYMGCAILILGCQITCIFFLWDLRFGWFSIRIFPNKFGNRVSTLLQGLVFTPRHQQPRRGVLPQDLPQPLQLPQQLQRFARAEDQQPPQRLGHRLGGGQLVAMAGAFLAQWSERKISPSPVITPHPVATSCNMG